MKPPIITIGTFDGVWTNADLEDVPTGVLSECKNMQSKNGKLVKTFGFGAKIPVALEKAGAVAGDCLIVFWQDDMLEFGGFR